jgi:DNA-binding IscR family transcriptional regulator
MGSAAVSKEEGFDRLQRLLLDMRAGDQVRVAAVAETTGLSESICLAVLEGLERAGLMTRAAGDHFVRRTLDVMAS